MFRTSLLCVATGPASNHCYCSLALWVVHATCTRSPKDHTHFIAGVDLKKFPTGGEECRNTRIIPLLAACKQVLNIHSGWAARSVCCGHVVDIRTGRLIIMTQALGVKCEGFAVKSIATSASSGASALCFYMYVEHCSQMTACMYSLAQVQIHRNRKALPTYVTCTMTHLLRLSTV